MSASSPTPTHAPKLSGLLGFTVIMAGQVVSLVGTAMSSFALTVWVYERTGRATSLALVGFFYVTPLLVISPLAGAVVDRANRKAMMALSDLGSALVTLALLGLNLVQRLEIGHLYAAAATMGAFQTFQWPATSAAITTMMPKEHYGRANGMVSLAETGAGILAPLFGAALYGFIGLSGVLTVDILTFGIALATLALVYIPQPPPSQEGKRARGSLLEESLYGFRFIGQRPGLLGLQLIFMAGNFLSSIAYTMVAPMILARTQNNALVLGTVNSVGAIGGLVGGLLMSAWGGPRRKVHGVLGGWALEGLLGAFAMGLGRSLPFWAASQFGGALCAPFINASNQAIWQSKVPADVQGKVFSIRRLIAWFSTPLAALVAGPLADRLMEPAMQSSGAFASLFQPLVGQGRGAGMALIMVFCGLGMFAVGLGGYLAPAVRQVETLLPDPQVESPMPQVVGARQ